MHRCLEIVELLELICKAADKMPLQNSVRALQLTCRMFFIPASRVLWNVLPSLVPLLLTMPADLLAVAESPDVEKYVRAITFRRNVLDSDWERFDFYAQFVREIEFDCKSVKLLVQLIAIDNKILRQLETRAKSRILLPHLKAILAQPGENAIPIALLLSPSIRSLRLTLEPDCIEDTLQLFGAIAPISSIRRLRLDDYNFKRWEREEFIGILLALETFLKDVDLEEFICEWLDLSGPDNPNSIVGRLVQMPLQELSILVDIPKLAATLKAITIPESKMKNLTIWAHNDDPSQISEIISSLQPVSLQTFRLRPPDDYYSFMNHETLRSLMSALGQHCPARALTVINVEVEANSIPFRIHPSGAMIDYVSIRPLFSFINLREFCFANNPMDLTDAEIRELAMSWPHLENLRFSAFSPPGFRPQATLKCLLWFAIYCRNISRMRFVLDATRHISDSDSEVVSMAIEARTDLKALDVGDSPINKPDEVAAFLRSIFPALDLFWTIDDDFDKEYQQKWYNVSRKLERYLYTPEQSCVRVPRMTISLNNALSAYS